MQMSGRRMERRTVSWGQSQEWQACDMNGFSETYFIQKCQDNKGFTKMFFVFCF